MKHNIFSVFLFPLILMAAFLGGVLNVSAQHNPVFYASMEQNDNWQTRASGFYSFAADGRGFTPVGTLSTKDITVTDGAVYHDGKVYYLRKTVESLFRYSLDWTVMDAETFQVESRTAKNGLTLAFDMTYDTTTGTCFASSPRSYGEQNADLRRVDLATGDFATIAQLAVCIRALTADSKGQLWGLGNEVVDGKTVTFLYKINKENGALERIGDVGLTMQETDAALTCDLRDDRIYWSASTYSDDENWQRTYRRGLCEIDTTTGRATMLWDYPGNAKMVGLFINTDHPDGFVNAAPLEPTDVRLEHANHGTTAVLSWTAPTQCTDRLTPLDPSTLTYNVVRRNDGKMVASGLKECRFEDTPDFPMQRVGYTVTAVTPDGQSEAVQSPVFVIGQPRTIPYLETFDTYNAFYTYTIVDANRDMNGWVGNGWFFDEASQTALYYTTLSHSADDWLVSPALQLSGDRVYRLRFGSYGYMGAGARNKLEVCLAQDLGGVTEIEGVVGGCAESVDGIRQILEDEYDTEATSPAFHATAQPRWYSILFHPEEDESRLAFHCLNSPADHMFIDNIYVEDMGPVSDFDLDHLNDGQYDDDQDLDKYDDDVLRYVNDLCQGEYEGPGIPSIIWSPATTLPRLKPGVQDCDALEAFSIEGGEGWTTYDGDGARTVGIGTNHGSLEWPHATEAQAFIVFNPYALGWESIIPTHSGEQCFVAFAAAGRACDDWLISPLLSGQKSRMTFWAKCLYPENLNEQFEVWASYTDAQPASAFRVAGPVTVSSATEWHEYSFILPEGVRYAMIRCVSDSQFGLMIDDITFPAAPAPTEFWGYNVYCNGECVAREVPECSYNPEISGTYTVTAQYAEGESRHSNAVELIIEGISPVSLDAERATPVYYDVQGRRVSSTQQPRIVISAGRKQL